MKKQFLERIFSSDYPGREDVVKVDVLPIEKDQNIKVALISTNSHHKQGAIFAVTAGTGYVEYEGKRQKGLGLCSL